MEFLLKSDRKLRTRLVLKENVQTSANSNSNLQRIFHCYLSLFRFYCSIFIAIWQLTEFQVIGLNSFRKDIISPAKRNNLVLISQNRFVYCKTKNVCLKNFSGLFHFFCISLPQILAKTCAKVTKNERSVRKAAWQLPKWVWNSRRKKGLWRSWSCRHPFQNQFKC